jgi:hypothetical protein
MRDGIISAINFKLKLERREDPEGGHRCVVTLDGKYQQTKTFRPTGELKGLGRCIHFPLL